jgi:hypothetical protein
MKTTLVLCLVALLALTAPAAAEPSGGGDGNDPPQSCITFVPGQTPPVIIQPSACLPEHDGPLP